jgi:Leucine-rich repeat (LRR) protein
MKQILLICAVVALVGCGKKEDGNTGVVNPNKPSPKAVPEKPITDPVVEKEIRFLLEKPTGKLTKTDLEKVKVLYLNNNQLTDVKGLEKLTQLTWVSLENNPDLTKAQIDELQKALPKCNISSNPTK